MALFLPSPLNPRPPTHATAKAPPMNVLDAMGDANFDVFVMVQCNSYVSNCDFSPDFVAAAEEAEAAEAEARAAALAKFEALMARKDAAQQRALAGQPMDACTSYGDCGSCLDDPSGVCGWCDGLVTDLSGNIICGQDGNGCCGGSDGFSQCNVNYRKICPVLCGKVAHGVFGSLGPWFAALPPPSFNLSRSLSLSYTHFSLVNRSLLFCTFCSFAGD